MQTTPVKANQKIGRYQIRSELGKGSMGVVYLAYDPQLDREVAVKTIRLPEGMGAAYSKKLTHNLLGEARLSGRLSHPGIVKVFDAGEEGGQAYIVLKHIEGTTLAQMLANTGVIEREEAAHVMEELLDAVAYAHDEQIVHRDLKPANIMIQADRRVRVMDFGIAHVMAGDAKSRAVLAGTPRYMSPEQIQGLDVDQRSDVFSLGVTLYEMLGGRPPFLQEEFNALREAVASERPAPLISLNPNLPPSFYQLVERALSKEPDKRFENAGEMRQALLECADDEVESPDQTSGPSPRARQAILERIRERVEKQGDFPATSQYIAKVTAK